MAGASGILCLWGVPVHVSKALEADYKGKHDTCSELVSVCFIL
jgi:hypothetical protein